MDLVRPSALAALPVPARRGAAASGTDRGGGMSRGRAEVRADLEEVFRAAYPRVVAAAARVLRSRDEA